MSNEEHLKIMKRGVAVWNQWRREFQKSADLRGADLKEANLCQVNLSSAKLSCANLSGANLSGARIRFANLAGVNLIGADLRNADLYDSDLSFSLLDGANFGGADLRNTTFEKAFIRGSNFSRSDLRGATFAGARLGGSNFLGVCTNTETIFNGASVEDCQIEKHALESLNDSYGGLTRGHRFTMRITDPVAILRASYSGFWQWIHLTALVLFLFPYAWFVIENWTVAQFASEPPIKTIALWEALLRFIWNGGETWNAGWNLHWSFGLFCFSFCYNILRFTMLLKTKTLELKEEANGLPVRFSLQGNVWGFLYTVAEYLFYMNLAVVLLHTIHFLMQRIPIIK